MRSRSIRAAASLCVILTSLAASQVAAQSLGTFRWQLQPYCNTITLTVVQIGDRYTLDGTDDRCGAPDRASASGLAFVNPSGSIGFGLTLVSPEAITTTLSATINTVTLSGMWADNLGQSGTFQFNPAAPGGGLRPIRSSIRLAMGHQNWLPLRTSDDLTFARFTNRVAITKATSGLNLVTASPTVPVLMDGRRLNLTGVQVCYQASANAVLAAFSVNTTTHVVDVSDATIRAYDDTDRTDETCRYFALPTPYVVGLNDAVNVVVHINFTVAGATFRIGRTTFIFEPATAEAPALDAGDAGSTTVLTVGGPPALEKEPPK